VPSAASYSEADGYCATLRFDVALGGEYTLSVSDVKDLADTPNTIITEKISFVVDGDMPTAEADYTIYIIAGAALVLVVIIVLIVVFDRKKKRNAAKNTNGAAIPQTQPMTPKPAATQAGAPSGRPIHFAVIDKDASGKTIDRRIGKSLVIGRSKECDITFDDPEMSRRHCEITLENGQLYVNDLKATNTTIVNGVPVHERIRLSNGDVLLVGQTELRVTWKD